MTLVLSFYVYMYINKTKTIISHPPANTVQLVDSVLYQVGYLEYVLTIRNIIYMNQKKHPSNRPVRCIYNGYFTYFQY